MTPPTAEERLIAYKAALFALANGAHNGLCWYIWTTNRNRADPYVYMEEAFPEVWKQRPPHVIGDYWFPFTQEGKRQRITVLENAIASCEQQIKDNEH